MIGVLLAGLLVGGPAQHSISVPTGGVCIVANATNTGPLYVADKRSVLPRSTLRIDPGYHLIVYVEMRAPLIVAVYGPQRYEVRTPAECQRER